MNEKEFELEEVENASQMGEQNLGFCKYCFKDVWGDQEYDFEDNKIFHKECKK